MKRIISVLIGLTIVCSSCIQCVEQTDIKTQTLGSGEFGVIHIPYVEEGEYDWQKVIMARYKDTKEPIPLSLTYSDRLYATVPKENLNREIEAFETDQMEFTDYNEEQYEFHIMQEMSRSGIIEGNENGEALPFANITRAEATAVIMRFLGLENDPNANAIVTFKDVNKNDWYYSVVMSAYYHGLIKGESETTFSPDRNVTREEFVVMAARAVEYAGLGYPGDENVNSIDKDKISSWAKDAYTMIGNYVETDVIDAETEYPKRLINPQKSATRYDVAYLLYYLENRCQVYPSKIAESFGFDKGMPIIDGSTSTYPFTVAVYGNLFSNGDSHRSRPKNHSKSHVTYEKLINGEIDMSFASVYPASDILELAKEKGVELELIPIAYDAMIFFTNANNPAEGLKKEQITNIYVDNAYSNWKELGGEDALLYPYCRNNDSGSHAQMEKHFLNGKDINEKIKQETTSETMSNILTDVMSAQTKDPKGYGLGYSIYYYFNNMDMFYNTKTELKLLSIDGVYPTDETIADGTYPLSNNTYIVIRKDTPKDSPARKMAEFMLTDAGQMCVEQAGFGKLK